MSAAPLRLGVVDQSPVRTGGTPEEALRETIELARTTERLGYTRYWLAEHHSTNSFAGSSPAVLLPAVAAATRAMRVGSGGVLLSHYSPLQVAEQFRTLEALFPGRIDLGVGRAPGGTHRAVDALEYGRGSIGIERYTEQVRDLLGWLDESFPDDHRWRRVRAMPRARSAPEVWLLGSGGASADHAAELGCGYSFAQFISGLDPAPSVRAYRERFRPSARMEAPSASVALGVVCAETTEEAEWLALSRKLWEMRVIRGVDRGIPSPEEAEAEFRAAGIPMEALRDDARVIAGDPARVREELLRAADRSGADELMIVTVTHRPEARVRSYELVAEALGLAPEAAG